ncbi:MAG: hypothetical protein K1X64_00500 [Myxococcaceae bacterium]|nr:hypothetical protein [Myxococcaceae bacterium]
MKGDETPLALVILAVSDVPRALAFYRHAFGWPLHVDTPVYAEMTLPNALRLGLYERHAFGRNTGQVPTAPAPTALLPTELYFYPPHLEAAMAQIENAGAHVLSPLSVRAWGDEAAYFADPDGNVIVLARPGTPSVRLG